MQKVTTEHKSPTVFQFLFFCRPDRIVNFKGVLELCKYTFVIIDDFGIERNCVLNKINCKDCKTSKYTSIKRASCTEKTDGTCSLIWDNSKALK